MDHSNPTVPGKAYAGVGSRLTPAATLTLCEQTAVALADTGWLLRSGHAQGADAAFERGAAGAAEIFLPWPTFRAEEPPQGRRFARPHPAAYTIAADHHPNWVAVAREGRALHARNCHQLLGWTLDDPAKFVICWTANASLDGTGRSGGTGQVLRLAVALGVPVFNLARPDHRERLRRWLGDSADRVAAEEPVQLTIDETPASLPTA